MNLITLINKLREIPADTIFPNGFGVAQSYRGYYEQIAFNPQANTKAGYMLDCAKLAMGAVMEGYKGGNYRMHGGTEVNIANWGDCGEEDALDEARWQLMLQEARDLAHPKTRNEEHKVLLENLLANVAKCALAAGIAEMIDDSIPTLKAGKAIIHKDLNEARNAFTAALDMILPDGMKT